MDLHEVLESFGDIVEKKTKKPMPEVKDDALKDPIADEKDDKTLEEDLAAFADGVTD